MCQFRGGELWMVDPRPFSRTNSSQFVNSMKLNLQIGRSLSSLVGSPTTVILLPICQINLIDLTNWEEDDFITKSYPNHSSSYVVLVPSLVLVLVVILPPRPSGLVPSPPGLRPEPGNRPPPRWRRSVFGRFRQNSENGQKQFRPRRCLPRGSVFRACFLALFFLEFFLVCASAGP